MQKYILILLGIIGVLVLGGTAYDVKSKQMAQKAQTASTPSAGTSTPTRTPAPPATPSNDQVLPAVSSTPELASTLYYPMTRYEERISNRWYGKNITAADREPLPCGFPFDGYHTGDDLEVFNDEISTKTPVFSIASGSVTQVAAVNGYGGLIVISHNINGQAVTAYYGHINLQDTTIKEGDTVTAGQQITTLGDNCSPQAGGERKHLHFAIRAGDSIDVKGYAATKEELAGWINPRAFLLERSARSPQ